VVRDDFRLAELAFGAFNKPSFGDVRRAAHSAGTEAMSGYGQRTGLRVNQTATALAADTDGH